VKRNHPPIFVAAVILTFPLVGIALGAIFLKEMIDLRLLAGAGMVVSSIILVNRGK